MLVDRRVCLLMAGSLALAGCGIDTYEQRLGETRKYYAYLEKLDANLAPSWKEGPVEELRVPLQFKNIRKPPPTKNEQGETVEAEVDPRQPNYLGLELPGLLATWETPLDVVVDGQKQQRKGYIYAVSNYSMFSSDLATQAPEYTRSLLGTISDRLSLPPVELGKGERETHPRAKTDAYTVPNNFEVYRFKSDQLVVDGVPYTIDVYTHSVKDIQFDLLLFLPVGIDTQAKLIERVPLMLERLKVAAKKPPRAGAGAKAAGGGTPAPAQPATGF